TRMRLIRENVAFTIEHQATFSLDWKPLPPEWLHFQDDQVHLTSPVAVDFWEIDSDWNGELFRSRHQALRLRGQAQAPATLAFSPAGNLCLRMFSIEGECYQIALKHPTDSPLPAPS
ncbi:MAG: hypothetical protein ACK8QZ_09805, partial [Anaerolineales bacterium]